MSFDPNLLWKVPREGGREHYADFKDKPYSYFVLYPSMVMVRPGDVQIGRATADEVGKRKPVLHVLERMHWNGKRPSHLCPVYVTDAGQKLGDCPVCEKGFELHQQAKAADQRRDETTAAGLRAQGNGLLAQRMFIFQAYMDTGEFKLVSMYGSFLTWLDAAMKNPLQKGAQFFGPNGLTIQRAKPPGKNTKIAYTLLPSNHESALKPQTPLDKAPLDLWAVTRSLPDWIVKKYYSEDAPDEPGDTSFDVQPSLPSTISIPTSSIWTPNPQDKVTVVFGPGDERQGIFLKTTNGLLSVRVGNEVFDCAPDEVKPA